MRPSDLFAALTGLYKLREATFIWSAPGLGKTTISGAVAKLLEINFLDIRLYLHDPSDFKFPLPDLQKRTIEWVCTLFPADPKWCGIICLDELPQCVPLIQNVASQVALERKCGDYRLPDGAWVLACGNRLEDRANTHRMGTHLLSRFTHLDLEVSNDDWQQWAIENDVDMTVRSYLNMAPADLHQFDPSSGDRAFPCPRSWEASSRIIKTIPDDELLRPILAGKLGQGVAAKYMGFRNNFHKLPDLNQILNDPSRADVPTEPAVCYALSGAIAEKARKATDKMLGNIVTYMSRLRREYQILVMRDSAAMNIRILDIPEAQPWLKANVNVLFPPKKRQAS